RARASAQRGVIVGDRACHNGVVGSHEPAIDRPRQNGTRPAGSDYVTPGGRQFATSCVVGYRVLDWRRANTLLRQVEVNRITVALAFTAALVAGYAAPSRAGGINLNGPHYNLNIIGVENPKTDPMTGGDRHTIFVALGSKTSSVTSRIYLTPGSFAVCDGNAFDTATACDGSLVAQQGAVFQLPCDTAVQTDTGSSSGRLTLPIF